MPNLADKIPRLQAKSTLYQKVRNFFLAKGYWECETPLMTPFASIEEYIESVRVLPFEKSSPEFFLISSPEYFMKHLIAKGSGDCFQITKVFRAEESSRFHNNEFTMLEWYKTECDQHAFMEELGELLQTILHTEKPEKITYFQLFETFFKSNFEGLEVDEILEQAGIKDKKNLPRLDGAQEALDFLFSFYIQPELGKSRPVFVEDFPAAQASLAKLNPDGKTAARFEAFYKGIELCNGYLEITEPELIRERLEEINQKRISKNKKAYPIDTELIEAFRTSRISEYSGAAMGMDRLAMLALEEEDIKNLLAFDMEALKKPGSR